MIVFDLRCDTGHRFEAWFGSSADYDDQRARGLLACPLCDSHAVEKAVMAPAVAPKGNRRSETPAGTAAAMLPAHPDHAALAAKLAELKRAVESSCDWVGDRFAAEARAIHEGEAEARGIYGKATPDEVRALHEDGIEVAPLPFRPREASDA